MMRGDKILCPSWPLQWLRLLNGGEDDDGNSSHWEPEEAHVDAY